MKKLLLLVLLSISVVAGYAQDTIIKRNGDEIEVRVLEVRPETVLYKRFDNLEGPVIHILKSDVFMIKYQNGTKEVFKLPAAPPAPAVVPPDASPARYASRVPADTSFLEQLRLNGPRIGATFIARGEFSDRLRDDYEAKPILSQFGWQFETQFFSTPGGISGLFEIVPLIGGLEQGLFLPSASALVGLRGKSGLELGLGPNLSLAGAGLVVAAGTSFSTRYLNFPVNFAVVPSEKGTRYSLLFGFNYRSR